MNTNTMTAQSCSLFEIDAELEAAFDQLQEEREVSGTITDAVANAAPSCSPNWARRLIASQHTCAHSNAKPPSQPKKHSGCSSAAAQPSNGSVMRKKC